MNNPEIREIRDHAEDQLKLIYDVKKDLRSVFTVIITLFILNLVFKIKPPIDTSDFWNAISSSIILWGFIYSVFGFLFGLCFLFGLIHQGFRIFIHHPRSGSVLIRGIFLVSICISTIQFPLLVFRIGGIIGFVVCILIYLLTGNWRIFPGEDLSLPDWDTERWIRPLNYNPPENLSSDIKEFM